MTPATSSGTATSPGTGASAVTGASSGTATDPATLTATGTAVGVLLPGFAGPTLPEWLASRLRAGLAGVCLFATNIESPAQLRALTDAIREANPLALIAIDEEGGDVTRLYSSSGSPYPGNALLGRIDDTDFTQSVATSVGWELRRVGINLNFAPDVDINSNQDNPVIGTRSFGASADLVARHTAAWVTGLQSTAVAASVKHFPGHGDTATDSHLALPVVRRTLDELRERELVPFVAAIAAETRTLMTSHILLPEVDPENPATLSATVLTGLLRTELGFDGVIVTDALDMRGASGETGIPAAAVRALVAGADLLCIGPENIDDELGQIEAAISAAVRDGSLSAERLGAAVDRNHALARALASESGAVPVLEAAEPRFPLEPAMAAFDARPGLVVSSRRRVVTIETVPNIAVGTSPWGLAAAGVETVQVHGGDALPDTPEDGEQLVIVGKDNHRHAWVRELVDVARERHPSTLVIDMGWPSDGRQYADVATFGASRYVGQALAAWLKKAEK
jgi:beta-N-acetylhexosaminidase